MASGTMNFTDKLIDILIGVLLFTALFGVIIAGFNGVTWSALNIAGTVYNMSWAPYVIVLLIVIGLVYFALKFVRGKQ